MLSSYASRIIKCFVYFLVDAQGNIKSGDRITAKDKVRMLNKL